VETESRTNAIIKTVKNVVFRYLFIFSPPFLRPGGLYFFGKKNSNYYFLVIPHFLLNIKG
jgi:hypothetical protein